MAIRELVIYKVVTQQQTAEEKCSLLLQPQKMSFGLGKTNFFSILKEDCNYQAKLLERWDIFVEVFYHLAFQRLSQSLRRPCQ